MPVTPREAFARTIIAFESYLPDVVFIGGWVHAIYLADAGQGERPILTDDIDVTIPHRLLTAGRPQLIDLATAAGFEEDELSGLGGAPVRLVQPGMGASVIDLDLITHADVAGSVPIEGQPGLRAQGYPWQEIALENWMWLAVNEEVHPTLAPPRSIKVPTISAYLLLKGLSSSTRTRSENQAKDLVYLHEIARHPVLGKAGIAGVPALAEKHPVAYKAWREYLSSMLEGGRRLRDVAEQLQAAARAEGDLSTIAANVTARLRRVLAETPEPT